MNEITDISCKSCDLCIEQPPNWEHKCPDGVFIKQMYLRHQFTLVPQHAHAYDHTSMLAVGSVRAWADGVFLGDYHAPCPIFIKAKVKHTFQSLEPDTLIYCIHNASRTGGIDIHERHELKVVG